MKYFIPEDLSLGDSFMCMFGNDDATKKVITKAMEYIEKTGCKFPSYSCLANVVLVSDEGKENTIAIQRYAVTEAGYTGWGGIMGDGPYDGPSRELFIMAMAQIELHGWDKWISSLITKVERDGLEKESMKSAIDELVRDNRFIEHAKELKSLETPKE